MDGLFVETPTAIASELEATTKRIALIMTRPVLLKRSKTAMSNEETAR